MPIVSGGGGGGGGPAAGSYWPVGNKTGVTVDSTTYPDTIKGGGAKLTTLVFPGDQSAFGLAIAGDAHPRMIIGSDATDTGVSFSDGTTDPSGSTGIFLTGGGLLGLNGYAPPSQVFSTRETVAGNNVTIANTATTSLTWDTATGTALLDLTNPAAPAILSAGIYAITAVCATTGLTAAGAFIVRLGNSQDAAQASATSSTATAGVSTPITSVTLIRYFAAGTTLSLLCTNNDGAASRVFALLVASIQRIT